MAASIDSIIQSINETDRPLTASAIYGLSDLSESNAQRLGEAWAGIPLERRQALVQRIVETTETNFEMDFGSVIKLALTDSDDQIRENAVEATWIDESPEMMNQLIDMAVGDTAPNVRAAAVSGLGRFILQGELEEFDEELARRAQNIALKLHTDPNENLDVRRRALEAISNCGREGVNEMIQAAYRDPNVPMRVSAIFAMGRSCDKQWEPVVLDELDSDIPELRFEAARTAGELELISAVPALGEMLEDEDRELVEMAVWALGEIASDEAQNLLEEVMERADMNGDEALMEAAEEALESASLNAQFKDL
jgi:HEAT repeat protein